MNVDMKHFRQLLLTGALLLCAPTLLACSCKGKASVKEARRRADAVLLVRVVSEQAVTIERFKEDGVRPIALMRYIVEVEATFKRGSTRAGDVVVLYTGMANGDCGFPFAVGERYVVYGSGDYPMADSFIADKPLTGSGIYWTDICTRTCAFQEEEVKQLTELE